MLRGPYNPVRSTERRRVLPEGREESQKPAIERDLDPREIGARIRLAREIAGLTQAQLAELASFSKRSLQDYESGSVIPFKHFQELERLLRRPPEWFLYGESGLMQDDEIRRLQEEVAGLRDQLDEVLELLRRQPAARKERSS